SVAASARAAAPGVDVPAPTAAMVPVVLGDPVVALTAAAACAEHGLRAGCFRPPSVPPGTSRLRLTARADLTGDDLALVDQVLHKVLGPVASGR
ncbi:8-amino-7-oxononanoate synthase, partial [Actinomycetospora chibensis]